MDYCKVLQICVIMLSNTVELKAQRTLNIVVVVESAQSEVTNWISSTFKNAEQQNAGLRMVDTIVPLIRDQEMESYNRLCAAVSRGVSLILDLSWYPWQTAIDMSNRWGIPLIKSDVTVQQMVAALDQYLDRRNATDAALIFQSENEVDQGLYQLIGTSSIRVWVHAGLPAEAVNVLRNMRPSPSYYAVIGDTGFVDDVYRKAVSEKLVTLEMRWNLVITDYQGGHLDLSAMPMTCSILTADKNDCCKLLNRKDGCSCPQDMKKNFSFLSALIQYLAETFLKLHNELGDTMNVDCNTDPRSNADLNTTKERLYRQFSEDLDMNNETLVYWDEESSGLYMRSRHQVSLYNNSKQSMLAAWSANQDFQLLPAQELQPVRRFFRIGTTPAIPWTYPKLDPTTGEEMFTENGQPIYEGYCIDLIQKLSEEMDFEYEIVTPRHGTFGKKLSNGTWDGIVGDLSRGETDMTVAALIMTAEREEVIDFVAPYFEQTGILIVIRKAVLKTSLFKFMTVLRTEVWLSIVAALVVTGFMIWFLDKYSPYSARNDPDSYPYPCRQFTLKESFWFALTSFTPQGGGEAPKALSGRTLVAAYWLFVVLMLATFTANLAAFLTVERMQTPVSSLEQLGRQSRINYTVVESSTVHQYFINMKFAEDTLYRVWKEITLNATSDQSQYRVWDYPIREQYGHILLAINASGPVPNASVGFQNVLDHTDADYAFIHDSAQIKYEVTRNCNLTEVGEIFAEQPYAVAVQQGSHLQEEMSRTILDLQKERFLEFLTNKYWNSSARGACPDSDESEGITLESVGGVFIATLFGLGLAMVTLVWEVIYYKRKEKNQVHALDTKIESAFTKTSKETFKFKSGLKIPMRVNLLRNRKDKVSKLVVKRVTIGDSFKPVSDPNKPKVFFMS